MLLEEQASFQPTSATPEFIIIVAVIVVIALTIIFILGLKAYWVMQKPIYKVTDEKTYKSIDIGRKIESKPSTLLPEYWEITTKKLEDKQEGVKRDYLKVFSKYSLETVEEKKWHILNYGVEKFYYLPAFFLTTKALPPSLWYNRKVLKKGKKNAVIYFFFRLFRRPKILHDKLLYEYKTVVNEKGETIKDVVKDIKILQFEYGQTQKSYVFYTKFEKKEFFEKQDVFAWIQYPEIELVSIVTPSIPKLKGIITKHIPDSMPLPQTYLPETEHYIKELKAKNHDFYAEFVEIQQILKAKNEDITKKIENGILKEDDRNYYLNEYEIKSLELNSNYRKVKKIGDPITKLYEIEDLAQAQQNAQEKRDLRSTYELIIAEKIKQIKDIENSYQQERLRNDDLGLKNKFELQQALFKKQKDQEQIGVTKDLIDFGYRILKNRDAGADDRDAIINALKAKDEKGDQKNKEIEELRNQMKKLNESIAKLSSEEKLTLTEEKPIELNTMNDVEKFRKSVSKGV